MLVGALAGIGACLTLGGYPAVALVVAMVSASIVSLVFAGMVVILRVNQVIAGLSIVFFCQGLTGLIGTITNWQNKQVHGLGNLVIWPLSEIPVIGRIFFMQDAVVYLTVVIFFVVNWWLSSTMMGLRHPLGRREPGRRGCSRHQCFLVPSFGNRSGLVAHWTGRRLHLRGQCEDLGDGNDRWTWLDRSCACRLCSVGALASACWGALVWVYRGDHPAYRGRRHSRAAIFDDDDALSGHDSGHDVGRTETAQRHERTWRPRTTARARRAPVTASGVDYADLRLR